MPPTIDPTKAPIIPAQSSVESPNQPAASPIVIAIDCPRHTIILP
jgi:hypothetical protein